jgi:hypothetical protein
VEKKEERLNLFTSGFDEFETFGASNNQQIQNPKDEDKFQSLF